jgi:hypothetical protein
VNIVFRIVEKLIADGVILHSLDYSCGRHHVYAYVCTDRRGTVVRYGSAEQMAEWWISRQSVQDVFWNIKKALDTHGY